MEITLKFVSGHSICHMVIKNDDQSVVKKDILNRRQLQTSLVDYQLPMKYMRCQYF